MDFRQAESELSGEVEYLAALFAFKDQTLSAEDLQLAMARLVSGESPTMLEAIRSLGVVEPVRLAAAIKMAQLYCNMNSPSPSHRRNRNDFSQNMSLPRLQHHALGDDSDDEIEFEDAPEQPAAIPGPEYEWQPTSDWASHIYYVEDTLRGYTGGRLGIVSTFALCIGFGVVVWGVIESQIFMFQSDEGRTERSLQNSTADMSEVDPFNTSSGNTSSGNPLLLSDNTPAEAETDDGRLTSSADPSLNRDGTATTRADASPPVEDNSADDWLSIPISSVSPGDQLTIDVNPAGSTAATRTEAELLDEELMVAMTEIVSNDLTSARTRLARIYDDKSVDLDLQRDMRWLQLGVGVMLEQDTPDSIEVAAQWLRNLHAESQPLNHLLFARWLLRTSVAQKGTLADHFAANPPPGNELNQWLQAASGDYKNSIPALEANLKGTAPDPLNHLFLAIAYWVANRPNDVLAQLNQFDKALLAWPTNNGTTSSELTAANESAVAERKWLGEVSLKALEAAADKLRIRASSAR
jgi:hypothetical protein